MRCPTDGAELVMAERQGVEIDYCPSCRGIWLDRGELDKILDRAAGVPGAAGGAGAVPGAAAASTPGPGPAPAFPPAPGYDGYRDPGYRDAGYRDAGYREPGHRDGYRDDRRYDDRRDPRYGRKKRKESWLGDLLDFD